MNTEKPDTSADQSFDQVLEYHQGLKGILEEIQNTSDLNKLLPMLNQLRLELQEHFEREEGPSGFGAVVRDNTPNKAGEVDRLFAEHTEFLRFIRALQESVSVSLNDPIAVTEADIVTTTRELCLQILDHESRENELLSSSLYRDIGGNG